MEQNETIKNGGSFCHLGTGAIILLRPLDQIHHGDFVDSVVFVPKQK